MTLLEFRNQVRTLTRHVNDTVRLLDTDLNTFGNRAYRDLRMWMTAVAPGFNLQTSPSLLLAIDPTTDSVRVSEASISATFERVHRMEWLICNRWRDLEGAGRVDPNVHSRPWLTFREENGYLIFGPDNCAAGETVRALYHNTPALLSADGAVFDVPVALEQAIVYRGCAMTAPIDSEGAEGMKPWMDLAKGVEDAAAPALKKRYGVAPRRQGFVSALWY